MGAVVADRAPESLLHVLFALYLGATIIDSVFRKGFLRGSVSPPVDRHVSTIGSTVGGLGIGAVASFLGVGGSVMTVPLLRRRGMAMAEAIAMANPLSLPVAIAATALYAVAAPAVTHPGQVGYVNLVAATALLAGSVPTIALTRRIHAGRIPGDAYAIAYVVLLGVIFIAMIASTSA